jgi:phosphoketolase
LLTHTRPEVMTGMLWPLAKSCANWHALGYQNRGGTLDEAGMLFANRCSWAHALVEVARMTALPLQTVLNSEEIAAVQGVGDPNIILYPQPHTS